MKVVIKIIIISILLYACVSKANMPTYRGNIVLKAAQLIQDGSEILSARITLKIINNNDYAICIPSSSIVMNPNGVIQLFHEGRLLIPKDKVSRRIYDVSGGGYKYNSVFIIPARQEFEFSTQLQSMYDLNPGYLYSVSYSIPYVNCQRLLNGPVNFILAPSIIRDGISEKTDMSKEEAISFIKNYYYYEEWDGGVLFMDPIDFMFSKDSNEE